MARIELELLWRNKESIGHKPVDQIPIFVPESPIVIVCNAEQLATETGAF